VYLADPAPWHDDIVLNALVYQLFPPFALVDGGGYLAHFGGSTDEEGVVGVGGLCGGDELIQQQRVPAMG